MLKIVHRASLCIILSGSACLAAGQEPSVAEVRDAMQRAVRFFSEQVAVDGGYVWTYSNDLKDRRGEGAAGPRQIWIQPPGTPSVGSAFLRAYERTGDTKCLAAARRAAHALAWGQLSSGGWHYSINFDPVAASRYHYRRDVEAGRPDPGEKKYTSTFDDDNSQSAVRFLMEFDRAIRFADQTVHRAVRYALDHFLAVQRPNGGWPQRFEATCQAREWPVRRARYPQAWPRKYSGVSYADYYTLNDNVAHHLIRTMLLACDIYGDKACMESACRTGDFLIVAQMPEPQPAWAQQYNADMEPAWARKFEPPAVVSSESLGVVRSLGDLYVQTGQEKYLRPIPPFLDWLGRSRLADGRFARFYELQSNRPLYFTRTYELVYDDHDLPTHYAFKLRIDVPALRRWYEDLPNRHKAAAKAPASLAPDSAEAPVSAKRVREILRRLDAQGRWLEDDGHIDCQTFIRNLDALSAWIKSHSSSTGVMESTPLFADED